MEETYYKKILVSSGEMPEDGDYLSSHERIQCKNGAWTKFNAILGHRVNVYPEWYLKPVTVPSPKQEAIDNDITLQDFEVYFKVDKFLKSIIENCKSELYNKFKEKGEK